MRRQRIEVKREAGICIIGPANDGQVIERPGLNGQVELKPQSRVTGASRLIAAGRFAGRQRHVTTNEA